MSIWGIRRWIRVGLGNWKWENGSAWCRLGLHRWYTQVTNGRSGKIVGERQACSRHRCSKVRKWGLVDG